MGLRPFDTPAFQVGGAFQSKPEDTLQVSEISCMLDGRQILEEVSFSARSGKILAIAGTKRRGKVYSVPDDHGACTGRWERCRLTGNI